ncbi:MAG TPA: hypothetical protein VGR31_14870 [Planctomycetota bacterium]|jgi:hypothetical protein|nr:hypothetical protein [Planctomycetota bacterium]
MNLFCRLFGHTWVHQSENPKIRWTAAENMSEMQMQGPGEVRFWEECARCKERREVQPTARRVESAPPGVR